MPFHTPVAIVPKVVIEVCPTYVLAIVIASALTEILSAVPTASIVLPVLVKPLPAEI